MEPSVTKSVKTDIDFNSKYIYDVIPKLRGNRKVENRWGVLYQIAINNVLFGKKCLPYMPAEPSASLSEAIVESDPLYVCKQCKDCFRFQSSFNDHNKRRSWILGFWCGNCCATVCTHGSKIVAACPICVKKYDNKYSYMRRKGLSKQKLGVIKVFYNQCQLSEHIKMHNLNTLEMDDLMLMPLSANMCESDWSPEVEIICEALMEHSLLSHIHIMNWLNIHNLKDKWWKLTNSKSNNNMIRNIVENYQNRQLIRTDIEKSIVNELTDFGSNSVHNGSNNSANIDSTNDHIKDKNENNYSTNKAVDKNTPEHEDNPCVSTDITFVDCGPASQHFVPESLMSYVPRKRIPIVANSTQNKTSKKKTATSKNLHLLKTNMTCQNTTTEKADKSLNKNFVIGQSSKDCVQQCSIAESSVKKVAENSISKSIVEADINKILDNPIKILVSNKVLPKVLPKILPMTNSNHLEQDQRSNDSPKILPKTRTNYLKQNQTSKRNLKILNIQDSQKVGNKIILPDKTNSDHLGQGFQTSITNNNCKILSVESLQDANVKSTIDQLPSHLTSNKKLVVIRQDSNNIIASDKNKASTEESTLSTSVVDNSNDTNNTSSQKMCNLLNIKKQEKVVIKNRRKYPMKHKKNVTKNTENPSNLPIVNSTTKAIKEPALECNTSISTSTNPNKPENVSIEQVTNNDNSVPSRATDLCLTPSPSPSESSSNSGCIYESHVRQRSIQNLKIAPPQVLTMHSSSGAQKKYLFETISFTEKNGETYINLKIVNRISKEGFRDTCEVIPKYREQMIEEFQQLNSYELKKRIDHLQVVSEEMRKVLDFLSTNVLWEKSRSINTLQHILEKCLQKCNQDITENRNDDVILDEWESEISQTDSRKCPSCNKLLKPKSYIPAFSKLPKDDNIYCSCYKFVCHQCLSYQDNKSQFIAHQNYHRTFYPYICPACNSNFSSFKSLEVHTWSVCFHTLKKFVLSCKICEIDGFRDMESITRHIAIMHSTTKIACEGCGKVFSTYNEYVKHFTEKHPTRRRQFPVRLVICKLGNVIIRYENFMWYTDVHPAIRKLVWFKCPFCSLITVENKYTTTILNDHLRSKHLRRLSEILSKKAFDDLFGTQFLKINVNAVPKNNVNTTETMKDTIIPKIVNARTISSEIFEHGTEDEISLWKYDSNVAWSRVEIKASMANDDNEQNKRVLPKILSVESMSDLKSSKSKEAIMKNSIELKEKSNSQFSQAEIIIDEKDDPLVDEDAKEMKGLEDNKSKDKTKEPDKMNDELIEPYKKTLESSELPKTNIDGCIKVIDIRKICKPNIEPFVTTKSNSTATKDENTSYMTFIPQPPPLAKIPQHLLESREVYKSDDDSTNIAKKKKFLSRETDDKTKERIAIHGTTDSQEINIDYLCHLCGEQINTTKSVVQAHFHEKHSDEYELAVITPQLTRISSDFINGGYKQFISSRKRKADSTSLVSKRKRRWTSKKHIETKDASAPVGLCVEQETAEDGEGNFKCKKCEQRCTDMSDLREHIAANHRLKDRYLICLECGENFVVAPSLQMHLKAFHGIENPISYMNQNPSYAPGVNDDSEAEGKTTVANQCYVCMAVFEDKAAVDKHLRVHGMAFLNRKRIEARNALKSPEKKANVEEENIAKDSSKETTKQDKPVEIILEKLNVTM